MKTQILMGRAKYHGLSRKKFKKAQALKGSTPGKDKGELCQAKPLEKALAKYPRAMKTMPTEYLSFYLKKDKAAQRNTFFIRNFT